MKLINLLPLAIIALVLTATLVRAANVPQVLLNPSGWAANTDQDVYLSVKNTNGDNIKQVELFIPLNADGTRVYLINAVAQPAGWTYDLWPNRIVWKATGTGLAVNDEVSFGFNARSPSSGQYQWSWKTTDVVGGTFSGSSTTGISMASLAYFRLDGVPTSLAAGNSFKITVRVFGSDDAIKSDYVGKIAFTSSDAKALLPGEYTFTASDMGRKDFFVTYKTDGDQTVTVTDWSAKITQKSSVTNVKAGTATSVDIKPENAGVSPSNSITFTAVAKDRYDNEFDVTSATKWSIDAQAGGSWNANVYTAQIEGTWTVTGTYNSLVDGETLIVKKGAVTPPTPEPEENETEDETPTPTPTEKLNIETQDSLTIAPGANETFIVTVNNVGTDDLNGVTLTTSNVSSDWISVYPSSVSIQAGTSKDFLVVVAVPENTSETTNMNVIANSNEGVKATKTITLNIGTAPTGLMGLSKNLLNLGIVIVAVAALVLIAWELWFRKSK